MITLSIVLMVAAGFLLLSLMFKLLKAPLKLIFKFLLSAVLGYVALFILNFFGAWVGLSLGLNWINAVVVGVFGVPGVILLLLLQFFL